MYNVTIHPFGQKKSITYEKVRGDLILCDDRPNGSNKPLPVRVLILEDFRRVEIPMSGSIIEFSADRFNETKERMEAESGQVLNLKPPKKK